MLNTVTESQRSEEQASVQQKWGPSIRGQHIHEALHTQSRLPRKPKNTIEVKYLPGRVADDVGARPRELSELAAWSKRPAEAGLLRSTRDCNVITWATDTWPGLQDLILVPLFLWSNISLLPLVLPFGGVISGQSVDWKIILHTLHIALRLRNDFELWRFEGIRVVNMKTLKLGLVELPTVKPGAFSNKGQKIMIWIWKVTPTSVYFECSIPSFQCCFEGRATYL